MPRHKDPPPHSKLLAGKSKGRCKQLILLPKDALTGQTSRGIKLYNEGILAISLFPKVDQFIPDLIDHTFVINLFLLPAFERVDVEHFATVPFRELAV